VAVQKPKNYAQTAGTLWGRGYAGGFGACMRMCICIYNPPDLYFYPKKEEMSHVGERDGIYASTI